MELANFLKFANSFPIFGTNQMMIQENNTAIKSEVSSPAKIVLIAAGLIWIGRAILGLVFQPDYWDPQTVVDYTAVATMSLALILKETLPEVQVMESPTSGRFSASVEV